MRTRIRNVAAVLAILVGLSPWALPDRWDGAAIVAFFVLLALVLLLSAARRTRSTDHDDHLPPGAHRGGPDLGHEAKLDSQRPQTGP
jgi:uncharacterized protein (DUF58 family)